jgi:hypothetical protein
MMNIDVTKAEWQTDAPQARGAMTLGGVAFVSVLPMSKEHCDAINECMMLITEIFQAVEKSRFVDPNCPPW